MYGICIIRQPHITFTNLHQHSRHDTGVRVVARVIDEAANAHAPHRATLETSLMSNPN